MSHAELRFACTDDSRTDYGFEPFLRILLDADPSLIDSSWRAEQGAWGYGEYVCELEEGLNASSPAPVKLIDVLSALERGEYFYDLTLVRETDDLQLDVFDSTFLILSGPAETVGRLGQVVETSNLFARVEQNDEPAQ